MSILSLTSRLQTAMRILTQVAAPAISHGVMSVGNCIGNSNRYKGVGNSIDSDGIYPRGYVTAGPGSGRRIVKGIAELASASVGAYSVSDNAGARRIRKRVGRGLGSGKGKTSGRGHKGYHARAAKSRPTPGFEGGQAGILRAIPKLGLRGAAHPVQRVVRLDALAHALDTGRLGFGVAITPRDLVCARLLPQSGVFDHVVLLATGRLPIFPHKIAIHVSHASQRAISLVEAAGGSVTCFDYDRHVLRAIINPDKFVGVPTPSLPTNRRVKPRYFDAVRRGYLAPKLPAVFERAKLFAKKFRPSKSRK